MKTRTWHLLVLVLALACGPDEYHRRIDPDKMFVHIYAFVSDPQGNDLFNPVTPGYFAQGKIRVLFGVGSNTIEINNPMMDAARGFRINLETGGTYQGKYLLTIQPGDLDQYCNVSYGKEVQATRYIYIKWSDTETDTLKVLLTRKKETLYNDKIWLNGELVFEAAHTNHTGLLEFVK